MHESYCRALSIDRSINLRGLVFKPQIGTFEMRSQITCEAVKHGAKGHAMFFNQILGELFISPVKRESMYLLFAIEEVLKKTTCFVEERFPETAISQ